MNKSFKNLKYLKSKIISYALIISNSLKFKVILIKNIDLRTII